MLSLKIMEEELLEDAATDGAAAKKISEDSADFLGKTAVRLFSAEELFLPHSRLGLARVL